MRLAAQRNGAYREQHLFISYRVHTARQRRADQRVLSNALHQVRITNPQNLNMPRRIVYGISLWIFLGAAACTIASIILPNWISYTSPTSHDPISVTYGLHQRCSSITGECQPFPRRRDCHGSDRYFCSIWRSAGFLMNFALVAELACGVAYVTILAGGRSMRESGWKILIGLLGVVTAAEMMAMALVVSVHYFRRAQGFEYRSDKGQAFLYDHDNRFFVGWELDKSWALCTTSWAVLFLDAVGVFCAATFMSKEDDYELIPEPE